MFHRIALLSKSVRETLPNSGLLDQVIVIGIKNSFGVCHPDYLPEDSFRYALRLVDSFKFVVERKKEGVSYLNLLKTLIKFGSFGLQKEILLDLILVVES